MLFNVFPQQEERGEERRGEARRGEARRGEERRGEERREARRGKKSKSMNNFGEIIVILLDPI